jgi:hypothetical protein
MVQAAEAAKQGIIEEQDLELWAKEYNKLELVKALELT